MHNSIAVQIARDFLPLTSACSQTLGNRKAITGTLKACSVFSETPFKILRICSRGTANSSRTHGMQPTDQQTHSGCALVRHNPELCVQNMLFWSMALLVTFAALSILLICELCEYYKGTSCPSLGNIICIHNNNA